MTKLHIITPVKDSIELTIKVAQAINTSKIDVPYTYYIYNDNSSEENTKILKEQASILNYTLINIGEHTQNPSPNYLWTLQQAQANALNADAGLLIIESDVIVNSETIQKLFDGAKKQTNCGIAAAVTVDTQGNINYPYLFAKDKSYGIFETKKHLSFCCSLLTHDFLSKFDFHELDPKKDWHDVTISHKSLAFGFTNYLFTSLPVVHYPHSSRPWKQLKYTNPLKYYWFKITKKRDKI